MSDVQRWTMQHLVGKVGLTLDHDSNGEWVTYADHARIVAEMEQAHAAALGSANDGGYREGYIEGKHDAEKSHSEAMAAALGITRMPPRTAGGDRIRAYYAERGEEVPRIYWATPPRTLTADDPEPAVGSVVLDADGDAWQRVEEYRWDCVDADSAEWPWVCADGPVTLIHDEGATPCECGGVGSGCHCEKEVSHVSASAKCE